jgi:class 3 adenylate cyclase
MPRLIQLFSFDVVGSALFKSAREGKNGVPEWLDAFQGFFGDIPLIFMGEIAQHFFDEPGDFPDVPLWKAIGDELVFMAEPESERDLQLLTRAFAVAMAKANQRFQEAWGLRIHGATWSFEEGERNLALRLRELEQDRTHVLDLIGPDVDLGFRLIAHAPAGSVLIPLAHRQRLQGSNLVVETIGEVDLKGIRLSPYPLLQVLPPVSVATS